MSRNRLLSLAILFASIAGCTETALPIKPIAGNYHLAEVNRAPLPSRDSLNPAEQTIENGTLTMTDSTYAYTVCVDSTGFTDPVCGDQRYAISDSGLVWWSPRGPSFVGTTSHISRALVVGQDTLIFNANDFALARLTFVR